MRGVDYTHKDSFHWISAIRLPDFIGPDDLAWAIEEATRKKKADFSAVEHFLYEEGLCVQCMHTGPYDSEPATIRTMDEYARANGCVLDITDRRHHHEIYLGDPRRTDPARLKTILRHPVKRA